MNEVKTNNAQTISELAVAATEVRNIDGHPFVFVCKGQKIESIEHLLQTPKRKSGTIELQDQSGFTAYFKRHQNPSANIYADRKNVKFTAVFNDDTAEAAGWKDHKAVYNVIFSREWQEWDRNDKVRMSQAEFAAFIERNLPDIREPNSADMMEIASTLEASKKASFSSGVRLSNGSNQFSYEEDIRGTVKNGRIEIPESFTLGLPAFLNGQHYEMKARLRYRINKENQLEMWYERVRPQDIIEDAFNQAFAEIESATGAEIINANI